uniref:Uncharacterized protein n=1 Tax=Alexandrium catenella TaxID=2925 RepID=A0A7S1SBI9_ALECA
MKQQTDSKPLLSQASQAKAYDGSTPSEAVSGTTGAPTEQAGTFPLDVFACLPPAVVQAVPRQFKTIQCWAHLVLVVGTATSIALAIDTLISWYYFGCRTRTCQGRVIPLVFVACCSLYFVRTLQQFDEDLIVKQRDVQNAKDKLSKHYQETVAEMDACIAKSMDAQATFAERSFDAKRRDFQRFLQKVSKERAPSGQSLATEFRRFVAMWLSVFQECSIDPVSRPLRPLSTEELDSCDGGPAKVAELVAARLRATQVKFISGQLDADRQELSGVRKVWNRLTEAHAVAIASKRASVCARRPDAEAGTLSFEAGAMAAGDQGGAMQRGWLQAGVSPHLCALDREKADASGFPVELHCCRTRCTLLSAEHVQLLLAFVLGFVVLRFELFVAEISKCVLVVNIGTCLLCIAFVLYEFVDIDILQQLETQLRDVLLEQEKLEGKRKAMLDFYDRAQQLADVWLHRTIPRLELLKQFSEEVEDSLSEDFAASLRDMTSSMEALEQSLPALPLWLSDKAMGAKTMKDLGEAMTAVTKATSVKAALAMMPKCSSTLALESARLQSAAQPSGGEAKV